MYRYSIRHPRRVVLLALLVTLAAAPGLTRLRLRTDGNALVPSSAPEVRTDRAIRDEFGVRDWIVVVLQTDDPAGVFNLHTLDLVAKWTERFGKLEGLEPKDVISLATEKTDRVFQGTLRPRGFLDPFPGTQADLDQIRSDLDRIRLYTGALVSSDGHAAAILIGVPDRLADDSAERVDRTRYYRAIQDIIAEHGPIPEKVSVVGAPVAESLLGTHILEDLGVPAFVTGRPAQGSTDHEPAGRRFPASVNDVRTLLRRYIGLVPITILTMGLVFFLVFRSIGAALLPLGEAGGCLVFVFGLMGWCGVPVYLTIAVLPIILIPLGINDEIHTFMHYRRRLHEEPGEDRRLAVERTMDVMWPPVVKMAVTTGIGFLSFALSPLAPVRAFGIFAAVGTFFCMGWSLTVIPAGLALLKPPRPGRRVGATNVHRPESLASGFLRRLGRGLCRWRYAVVLISLGIILLASFGARRVEVQDSWVDGFARDSGFYQATQTVNQLFNGTHILLVCVDAGDEVVTGRVMSGRLDLFKATLPVQGNLDPAKLVGRWIRIVPPADPPPATTGPTTYVRPVRMARITSAVREGDSLAITIDNHDGTLKPLPYYGPDEVCAFDIRPRRLLFPDTLQQIAGLEAFIEGHRDQAVGRVLGPADYAETTNYMMGGQNELRRQIPADPAAVRFMWQQYERVRGAHRYREVVNPEQSRALVTVFLKDADYVRTRRLMDDLREYERTQLAPHGISLTFAGDIAVSQALIDAIVTTQVRSLLGSLLGNLLIVALLSRSLGLGVYCILPCSLAVLINFAVMGLTGMPLGVATSMFSAMILGVGVDYAIHQTERFKHAVDRGLPPEEAVVDALATTSPANLLDAAAISLGFSVLLLSQVPSNARVGGLVVLSVVNCLAATMLLLPALLAIWRPRALRPRAANPGCHTPLDQGNRKIDVPLL